METLRTFKTFVEEILGNNSRTYKEQILEKYKDNDDVKYYLNFLLNPYITTGISDKKLNKTITMELFGTDDVPVKKVLDWISEHNTGTDRIICMIQEYRENRIPTDLQYIFNGLITKNIKLGIDAKTVNKVIPNLIPEFNVQLANKYFDNPDVVTGKEFAITTKSDGGRIIAVKENGIVKFFTRAGQEYEGLVDLEKELVSIPDDNFVLDGEITLLNPGKLVSKEQYKETMKITRKDGEKHGVKMLVFDMMPVANFKMQQCPISYWSRRGMLTSLFDLNNFTYFKKLPILYKGTDTSKIMELLEQQVSNGEEGVMINIISAPYEFKRTSNLLKVKKMNDLDLEVIGFEEGTNRLVGTCGALLVNYKGNVVKVGTGLSDDLRKEIWNNQQDWLGRTVVIKYFEETTNQNGGTSLRFPVYVDYRTDK